VKKLNAYLHIYALFFKLILFINKLIIKSKVHMVSWTEETAYLICRFKKVILCLGLSLFSNTE